MVQQQVQAILYVHPDQGDDRATGDATEPLKTLTAALQQAATGTVIHLSPGAYTIDSGEVFPLIIAPGVIVVGHPASRGRGITILGGGEFNSPTFAQQRVTLVLEDNAQLRGITVTNPIAKGTGIWIENTQPTIANCTLRHCQREGIFVTGTAKPAIANCLFQANVASGIAFVRSAKGEVRRSLFLDNGLGMVCSDRSAPLIIDSQFAENRCGLVLSGSSRVVLRSNTFESNSRTGLAILGNAQPDLGNAAEAAGNLFQGNRDSDLQNQTAIALCSAGNQLAPTRVSGVVQFIALQSSASPVVHPTAPLARPSADWATGFIQGLQAILPARPFQPASPLSQAEYQAMLAHALQLPPMPPRPDAILTRLEAIVSLVQQLGLTPGHVGVLAVYRDRAQIPSQCAAWVAVATQHRLVVLYPQNDRLNPLLPITQAEAAAMIYQTLVMQGSGRAIASTYIVNPAPNWVAFADIQGHWAQEWIQGAVSQGWFEGLPQGMFEPDALMSVAEYAEWFAREDSATLLVPDPQQPILRVQVLQSLMETLPLSPSDANLELLDRYDDAAAIPEAARGAIARSTAVRLVVNYPQLRRLNPNQPATRAEIAAMVYQALVYLGQCPAIASPYLIDPHQPQQVQPRDPQSPLRVVLQPNLLLPDPDDEAAEIILSIAEAVSSLLQFQEVEVWVKGSPAESSADLPAADLWMSLQLEGTEPSQPDRSGIAVVHAPTVESARLAHVLHKTIVGNIDTRSRGVQPGDRELPGAPVDILVCLQLGCLANPEDAINLNNAEYRRCLSQSIAEGILAYLQAAF
jgi:parallel beta-helix repeat protein